MKKLCWKLLKLIDSNIGYSTPLQERFNVGHKCKIHRNKSEYNPFDIGEEVVIIETGRHDYLIKNKNGKLAIVYQFELI